MPLEVTPVTTCPHCQNADSRLIEFSHIRRDEGRETQVYYCTVCAKSFEVHS